jgi:hypothetical protein
MLKVLLILCVAAVSTVAAAPKKNPDVEKTVKSELVGKSFATKILVGSYIPCQNSSILHAARNDAIKMVDTELSPDGSVKYFARANCSYPGGMMFDAVKGYVPASFSSQIDPGTSVWVRSVDFKEDRVEINLSTNNSNSAEGSGKIKYMVGPDYHSWPADQLMESIAQGITIPTYERLIQLKSEYDTHCVNLQKSENYYNSIRGPAAAKLRSAISLRQVLEKIQKNRAEFTAMGKSDPDAGVYSEKLSALAPEIARLTEEARKDRVAQLRNQLQAQLPKLTEVQNQVREKPPSSLDEWQQRKKSLDMYSNLLDERQKLSDRLRKENETPSQEDYKYMDESRAEIETVRNALEQGHQQIELADLTSEYRQLAKKHDQLKDAYSLAVATFKERAALQNFIAVLDKMVANRERAAELGDKTAATQLTRCRAEAAHYRR